MKSRLKPRTAAIYGTGICRTVSPVVVSAIFYNPYSLLQVFGRGHVIGKSVAVAYVTRCNPVEVLPRVSSNCMEEIPVTWNNSSLYVDPISYVIKSAAYPTRCNDIAPPRWKIAGRWYCAYPSIRECAPPMDLPVKPVNIDEEDVLDLGLGRSIYSEAQVEEFLKFHDSQGTRRAYLTETAELAYGERREDGSWGLGLGERAREALIDTVGWSLVPLYRLTGPVTVFILFGLLLWSIVKVIVSVIVRACTIYQARGMGLWLLGVFWSLPFQLIISPVRWASEAASEVADKVAVDMEA
jgi:hypothetical protein